MSAVLSWESLREDAQQEAAIAAWEQGRRMRPWYFQNNLIRHEDAQRRVLARYLSEHRHDDAPIVVVNKRPTRKRASVRRAQKRPPRKPMQFGSRREYLDHVNALARAARYRRERNVADRSA